MVTRGCRHELSPGLERNIEKFIGSLHCCRLHGHSRLHRVVRKWMKFRDKAFFPVLGAEYA